MNPSAFPHSNIYDRTGQVVAYAQPGMTTLDVFAIEALKGILSDRDHAGYESPERRVELAWKYAALMLKARAVQ